MKTFAMKAMHAGFLVLFSFACQHEEKITPVNDGENVSSFTISNLKLLISFPDLSRYDSAHVTFQNSSGEIKQMLALNNSSYLATGIVPLIPPGEWKISTSFFSTIQQSYLSLEKNAVVTLRITPSTTELIISKDGGAFIQDGNTPVKKYVTWDQFYYYQLYEYSANTSTPEGYLRLSKDPTNPFVQIVTFKPNWIYAYVDRSFYNRSPDGSTNYYQGGAGFEIYGASGGTYDRLEKNIIDISSLSPGISEVLSKEWNYVDSLIIIAGANNNQEILVYHIWDSMALSSGRIKSRSVPDARTRRRAWNPI